MTSHSRCMRVVRSHLTDAAYGMGLRMLTGSAAPTEPQKHSVD